MNSSQIRVRSETTLLVALAAKSESGPPLNQATEERGNHECLDAQRYRIVNASRKHVVVLVAGTPSDTVTSIVASRCEGPGFGRVWTSARAWFRTNLWYTTFYIGIPDLQLRFRDSPNSEKVGHLHTIYRGSSFLVRFAKQILSTLRILSCVVPRRRCSTTEKRSDLVAQKRWHPQNLLLLRLLPPPPWSLEREPTDDRSSSWTFPSATHQQVDSSLSYFPTLFLAHPRTFVSSAPENSDQTTSPRDTKTRSFIESSKTLCAKGATLSMQTVLVRAPSTVTSLTTKTSL